MTLSVGDKRNAPLTQRTTEEKAQVAPPSTPEVSPAVKAVAVNVKSTLELPAQAAVAAPPQAAAPVFAVPTNQYQIKSGDTLGKIATRFDNELKTVVADNQIANPNQISVGQKIKLRDTVLLNVEKGDTLKGLSAQYRVKEADLATANGLKAGAAITAGSQLKLPNAVFYTVKSGDTLSGIANKFGTTAGAIAKANELNNANLIRIDQKLVVVGTNVPGPTPKPKPDPLADPKVMKDHRGFAKYQDVKGGQLYVGGISENDIKQGQAGDCYFLAAISSLAKSHPEVIKNVLKANGDGSYTATFHEVKYEAVDPKKPHGEWRETFTPVKVKIDGDLPRDNGWAVYAEGGTNKELWAPLLEKAYAKWKGGYEQIGNGGWSDAAFEELTGKPAEHIWMDAKHPPNLVKNIQQRLERGEVLTASSKADKAVKGTGIVGNHAYTILGAVEKDGKPFIQLRNPWGNQEYGKDGKDDGVFLIPAAKFRQTFDGIQHGAVA